MSYIAKFLTPDLNTIGSKRFKPTDSFITFKKGTFNVRLDAYLYKDKNFIYYAYIYPTDEKLIIDIRLDPITKDDKIVKIESARIVTIKEKMEKGDLHFLVAESIIGQLARAFMTAVKTNWILIIAILVAGVAIGYIVGTATTPTEIVNVINATVTATNTPTVIRP